MKILRADLPRRSVVLAELPDGLGELALDFADTVDSVDLNPVIVQALDGGVIAMDVLVMLKRDEQRSNG